MRIQRAAPVCANREPQPGERIQAAMFTQSRRALRRAAGKRRCSSRAVRGRAGTQGRVLLPSHPLPWSQSWQRCPNCPWAPEGPRHLRAPAAGAGSDRVTKEGTGDRGTGPVREDRRSRQSRQAPADVASAPKGARCCPGSHHQERLCAHQGAALPLSQPRNGISLPVLAPPSPFVSFLHPRRFCPRWMRYFGKQGPSSPSSARTGSGARGCSSSAPDASGPGHPSLQVLDFSQ